MSDSDGSSDFFVHVAASFILAVWFVLALAGMLLPVVLILALFKYLSS